MKYYTYQINKLELDIILDYYKDKIKSDENYVLYVINKKDFKIKIYSTLKILFMGDNFFDEINILDNLLNRKITSLIGSDEVGFGDLFGPIIVVSCYLDESNYELVRNIGVRDSKQIKDDKIILIAKKLIEEIKIPYSCLVVDNKKYNEINQKYNMNKIKAILHNKAIIDTAKKIKKDNLAVIDQFCEPKKYYEYLNTENNIYTNIKFETKAESKYLAVACASIIARYCFIMKFDELSKKYNINFLKGCSNDVKKQFKEIKNNNPDLLNKIAKLNFNVKENY